MLLKLTNCTKWYPGSLTRSEIEIAYSESTSQQSYRLQKTESLCKVAAFLSAVAGVICIAGAIYGFMASNLAIALVSVILMVASIPIFRVMRTKRLTAKNKHEAVSSKRQSLQESISQKQIDIFNPSTLFSYLVEAANPESRTRNVRCAHAFSVQFKCCRARREWYRETVEMLREPATPNDVSMKWLEDEADIVNQFLNDPELLDLLRLRDTASEKGIAKVDVTLISRADEVIRNIRELHQPHPALQAMDDASIDALRPLAIQPPERSR